jgi:hypothetical protein
VETWTELFGFVPRAQLKQLVPHIGDQCQQTIGDRQFVSFVQFFLHKCGEVTLGLGQLYIYSSNGNNATAPIIMNKINGEKMPLADVPIPENVKNFKSIKIRFILLQKILFK